MSRRAGRRVRHWARETRWRYVRANWKVSVGACSLVLIPAVLVVVAMGLWVNRDMAFLSAGAWFMVVAFMLWFSTHSIAAQRLFDGAEGERFTASTLRRLRRRGWRSVDDLEFTSGNVDHVLAGPGGAFVVETKWTNVPWGIIDGEFDDQYARRAVRQCRGNVRLIGSLLRGHCNLTYDLAPLLVIWGPGRPLIDAPVNMGGVLVVPGPLLRTAFADRRGTMATGASRALISALKGLRR